MDEIRCSWGPGELRFAVVEDGEIAELGVVRSGACRGTVYLGRVVEVSPHMNACFVDIGTARPGMLDGASGRTIGQAILVQIRAEAQDGKGARLVADVRLPGRYVSFSGFRKGIKLPKGFIPNVELEARIKKLLAGNEGVLVRPPGYYASDEELAEEIARLRAQWTKLEDARKAVLAPAPVWAPDPLDMLLAEHPLISKIVMDDRAAFAAARALLGQKVEYRADAFADAEDAFEDALSPVIALPGGGRMRIERCAALTAIDVDSGSGSQADANKAAARAVARQLRLRGIGGQIVVDFISADNRSALDRSVNELRRAIADDPVPTHVIGATRLGLVEMTRERRGPSLAEMMLVSETRPSAPAAAFAALRRAVAEADHRPGRALRLVVAPDVAAILAAEPGAVAEAETRIGHKLLIKSDPSRGPADSLIED